MNQHDADLERQEREAIQAEGVGSSCEREAIGWALAGHPVIPVWWPEPDGSCACGNPHPGPESRNIGKHPITELVEHGVSEATRNAILIGRWFRKFPDANYGIQVGKRFVVLDFDSETSLARFKRALAELGIVLPVTIIVRSGRGFHVWLSVPENVEIAAPDFIETVKHGNAYVIGPGSLHVSGRRYKRVTPRGTPIGACPPALLERMTRRGPRGPVVRTGGKVPAGNRHAVWVSFAGYLHNLGLDREQKIHLMLALRDCAFENPTEKPESKAREIADWYEDKEISHRVTRQPA